MGPLVREVGLFCFVVLLESQWGGSAFGFLVFLGSGLGRRQQGCLRNVLAPEPRRPQEWWGPVPHAGGLVQRRVPVVARHATAEIAKADA